MTGVVFRQATVADLPQMREVRMSVRENVLSDPSKVTDAECVAYLTETGNGWVAMADGAIVGFSMVNRSGLIWALFVRPEYEGLGIGGHLLDSCTEWLRSLGVTQSFLDTAPGTRAEAFYRQRGWHEVTRTETKLDLARDLEDGRAESKTLPLP